MIAIFGASVTEQKEGYAKKLEVLLEEPVQINGYGGMHINNAGICYIDNILKLKPSYCFVDWLSTQYREESNVVIECIETIVYKLKSIHSKPIFLFFPRTDDDDRGGFYSVCKNYMDKKKIDYIDVGSFIKDTPLRDILVDSVHTNVYGSHLYAEVIYKEFKRIKSSGLRLFSPPKTRYIDMKNIIVNKVFDKTVVLFGDCEIIGFELTVGPHSGLVEIRDDINQSIKENTWDIWSHYLRKHFHLAMVVKGRIYINILEEKFDTSQCRREYDFSLEKKKLIVHKIYYIGNALSVENINDGSEIEI